jgi:hypothetical protein
MATDPLAISTGLGQGEAQILGGAGTDYYDKLAAQEVKKQDRVKDAYGKIKDLTQSKVFFRDAPEVLKKADELYGWAKQNIREIRKGNSEVTLELQRKIGDFKMFTEMSEKTDQDYVRFGLWAAQNEDKLSDDWREKAEKFASAENTGNFDIVGGLLNQIQKKEKPFEIEKYRGDLAKQFQVAIDGEAWVDSEGRPHTTTTQDPEEQMKLFIDAAKTGANGQKYVEVLRTRVDALPQNERFSKYKEAEKSGMKLDDYLIQKDLETVLRQKTTHRIGGKPGDGRGGDETTNIEDLITKNVSVNTLYPTWKKNWPWSDPSPGENPEEKDATFEYAYSFKEGIGKTTISLGSSVTNLSLISPNQGSDTDQKMYKYFKSGVGELSFTPGQIVVAPVYKKRTFGKNAKDQDMSGLFVPNDRLDSDKGTYEYKALVIGEGSTTGFRNAIDQWAVDAEKIAGAINKDPDAEERKLISNMVNKANELNKSLGGKSESYTKNQQEAIDAFGLDKFNALAPEKKKLFLEKYK